MAPMDSGPPRCGPGFPLRVEVRCESREGIEEIIVVPLGQTALDSQMTVEQLLKFVQQRVQRVNAEDLEALHLDSGIGGRFFPEDLVEQVLQKGDVLYARPEQFLAAARQPSVHSPPSLQRKGSVGVSGGGKGKGRGGGSSNVPRPPQRPPPAFAVAAAAEAGKAKVPSMHAKAAEEEDYDDKLADYEEEAPGQHAGPPGPAEDDMSDLEEESQAAPQAAASWMGRKAGNAAVPRRGSVAMSATGGGARHERSRSPMRANSYRNGGSDPDLVGGGSQGDPSRWPPLHKAVYDGDYEQVRRLLASGADVNEILVGSGQRTAIYYAMSFNAYEILELLLSQEGIRVDTKMKAGKVGGHLTPLEMAKRDGPHSETYQLFVKHGHLPVSEDETAASGFHNSLLRPRQPFPR